MKKRRLLFSLPAFRRRQSSIYYLVFCAISGEARLYVLHKVISDFFSLIATKILLFHNQQRRKEFWLRLYFRNQNNCVCYRAAFSKHFTAGRRWLHGTEIPTYYASNGTHLLTNDCTMVKGLRPKCNSKP